MAEFLANQVMPRTAVMVAPTINRRQLHCGSKPRPRFYMLNIGVSIVRPLEAAVAELSKDGIKTPHSPRG
jgi:hypothetical protein